jgi:hypothetical protein
MHCVPGAAAGWPARRRCTCIPSFPTGVASAHARSHDLTPTPTLPRWPPCPHVQPGVPRRSIGDSFSQLLSPQPTPPGSPEASASKPKAAAPKEPGPFTVQTSAASAPCLAQTGRVMFSPFGGRFGPKSSKAPAAGGPGVEALLGGAAAERCSRFNSFSSTQSLTSSPGSQKGSPNAKAPKQAQQAGSGAGAAGGEGSPLAKAGGAPAEPHFGWVEVDCKGPEAADETSVRVSAVASSANNPVSADTPPANNPVSADIPPASGGSGLQAGKEKQAAEAGVCSKFLIRVDAGSPPAGAPTPGHLYDVDSISQQAGLIPASRSQAVPLPAGLPISTNAGLVDGQGAAKVQLVQEAGEGSPAGSPGPSCLSGLKSRLSGKGRSLLPGGGGTGSDGADARAGAAGTGMTGQGLPPKPCNPVTAPALAQMLAPGPG